MTLPGLRGRSVHVIGPSGTEGSAVIDFLLSRGMTTITAHDLGASPEQFAETFHRTHQWLEPEAREGALARLLDSPVVIRYRDHYLTGIERADLIVVPQSWFRHPENAPLRALRERGVPFTSMTRLFLETCPCPIIGVTGTNGKFTVATLIYEMLRTAGRTVFFSGNDRTHVPMLYYLDRITPEALLVLEISNRQLVDLDRSPHIGVVTNVPPDVMASVLRSFTGLPYRFRLVAERGGIAFYEDSLATNPTAAAAAIRSLDRPFLLIAGGFRRGATPEDFRPMTDALAATGRCRAVLLIGATAPVLSEALATIHPAARPTVILAGTLEGAMAEVHRLARPAEAVLLSPGCESFDQFVDYRQRGDRFRALAEEFAAAEAK